MLSLFSFAAGSDDRTEALLRRINDDGRVYLTQTRHKGRFVIRVQVGQFDCTRDDVMVVTGVGIGLIKLLQLCRQQAAARHLTAR